MCINTVPPRWILEPTDKAFAQGSDARVECKADGFPKPQVTWKRAAGEFVLSFSNLEMINFIAISKQYFPPRRTTFHYRAKCTRFLSPNHKAKCPKKKLSFM